MTAKCVSTDKAITVTVQDALNRDSQAAFAESAAKLEALFNQAAKAENDLRSVISTLKKMKITMRSGRLWMNHQ